MVYTLDQIKEIVVPIAARYNLKAVYVFGSYARGEAREDSDIDFLIDAEGSGLSGLDFGGLYCDFEDALRKKIDMVLVSALEQPARHKSDIDFRKVVQKERREIYAAA